MASPLLRWFKLNLWPRIRFNNVTTTGRRTPFLCFRMGCTKDEKDCSIVSWLSILKIGDSTFTTGQSLRYKLLVSVAFQAIVSATIDCRCYLVKMSPMVKWSFNWRIENWDRPSGLIGALSVSSGFFFSNYQMFDVSEDEILTSTWFGGSCQYRRRPPVNRSVVWVSPSPGYPTSFWIPLCLHIIPIIAVYSNSMHGFIQL